MRKFISRVLPKEVGMNYEGYKIALWVFMLLSVVSFVRSCIHVFAPDGGAGMIAGLDVSAGAQNIYFGFALWGSAQLIYAMLQLMVVFRYKGLVPLMYLVLVAEILLRMLVGALKPPILYHTPPGAIANYIILPLAVLMFVISVIQPQTSKGVKQQ